MSVLGRIKVAKALQMTCYGEEIIVKGWVRTRRGNKNVSFIALNDGSTINNIQIVVDNANFDENELKKITTGACIGVTGTVSHQPLVPVFGFNFVRFHFVFQTVS